MKYYANPVIVDAFVIVDVAPPREGGLPGAYFCALDSGEDRTATAEMCARHIPVAGDYWVIQQDGYEYLNPKDVFERKYSPLPAPEKSDEQAA